MINTNNTISDDLIRSSLWGLARGIVVQPLTFPLQTIKVQQQLSHPPQSIVKITRTLFTEGGVWRFYQGLPWEITRISLKQLWCWPMITGIPRYLTPYHLTDTQKLLITGFSISLMDTTLTPLEKRKITSIATGKKPNSMEGWKESSIYFSKLSANWITFLLGQHFLRARAKTQSEKPLTLGQLTLIGFQVSLLVSIVSAPFDCATTIKFAKSQNPAPLFRGMHLNFLCYVINNIASAILIDWLNSN